MRLRSFSLSKIVPVEIINLIIHESSVSTLHAWTLVSFGCLSVAGPLLNKDVHLTDQMQILQVLQRMTLDETDPLVLLLPRLSLPLSLKNVRRLTILTEPEPFSLEALDRTCSSHQPERPDLELVFAWEDRLFVGEERATFRSFFAPTLVKLLRPGSYSDGSLTSHEGIVLRVSTWALQCYRIVLDRLPTRPVSEIFAFGTASSVLGDVYPVIRDFQKGRDDARFILSDRALEGIGSLEDKKEIEELREAVETFDVEQTKKMELLRKEGGEMGDITFLMVEGTKSAEQLDQVSNFVRVVVEKKISAT